MSSRKYKQYPAEFRESSAKLALESDQPISQTARELGVTAKKLYYWINAYSGSDDKLGSVKVMWLHYSGQKSYKLLRLK